MLAIFGTLLATTTNEINLIPSKGPAKAAAGFDIVKLITSAVNVLFVLAVVLFFFMLVIGGIRWITSGGDKAQTESAKGQITAAIVGLVVVLSTYAILSLAGSFFGVNLLDLNIAPEP